MNSMIPFFVADRPMSLRLLKGLPLRDYPGTRIGIMAHANTTEEFQRALRDYPCDDPDYCDAIGGTCIHRDNPTNCSLRAQILRQTVKMCDSGIFTKEGATLGYRELFQAYDRMNVEYGVMIDVFGDAEQTIQSAREALKVYRKDEHRFHLVGVAQGQNKNEYLACYERLQELGMKHVAVGGLLRKRVDTVRLATVSDEGSLFDVLAAIRTRHPQDWLFALGCFHPTRLRKLADIGVWADYKGWIFQYKKRNASLDTVLSKLGSNHLEHLKNEHAQRLKERLQNAIKKREVQSCSLRKLNEELVAGRRHVRHALRDFKPTAEALLDSEQFDRYQRLMTHSLMDNAELRLLVDLVRRATTPSDARNSLMKHIERNRNITDKIRAAESRLEKANAIVAKQVKLLLKTAGDSEGLADIAKSVLEILARSEREHRFAQVRDLIAGQVLRPLQARAGLIETERSGAGTGI